MEHTPRQLVRLITRTERDWFERARTLDAFIMVRGRAPLLMSISRCERALARWHRRQRRAYETGRLSMEQSWFYIYVTRMTEGN